MTLQHGSKYPLVVIHCMFDECDHGSDEPREARMTRSDWDSFCILRPNSDQLFDLDFTSKDDYYDSHMLDRYGLTFQATH